MTFWERGVNYLEKFSSYICFYIEGVGWIEPGHKFSPLPFPWVTRGVFGLIHQLVVVPSPV